MGCWTEPSPSDAPEMEDTTDILDGDYHERIKAFHKCYQAAKTTGLSMFAIYDGGYCISYPGLVNSYRDDAPAENCIDGLGGKGSKSVYKINQGKPSIKN